MKHLQLPFIFILNLLLLAPGFSPGQTVPKFSGQLKPQLDAIAVQDVPLGAPGIATAVIQNGQLVYQKCAGYADFKDSSWIGPGTRFNIASNGKQFTALAILTLVESGRLRLTDDLRKFFPQLYRQHPTAIPIQSLLNHTSGIRDCYDLWSLMGYTWWEKTFSNQDVLHLIEQQTDLNFEPNTSYLYSNSNYILLALIVEKVSGRSFVAYTRQLFQQLNMPNTSFEADYRNIRGPIARAYFNFDKWTTYNWIWNVCGDGNIFSTLADQIQWERILQGGATTSIKRSVILKSQQAIEKSSFTNYGYGLELDSYKGFKYTFHEGATGAWKATVVRFPAAKTAIITLTNSGKITPDRQTRQMADVVLGLKPNQESLVTRPAKVGRYISEEEAVGTYLTDRDFSFQFYQQDSQLLLKRVGRNDIILEREAANIFHQKYDTAFKQEFTYNEQGILQATAYYINHAPYSLTKQVAKWDGFLYQQLNGKYENIETGATMDIRFKDNKDYQIIFHVTDTTTGTLVTTTKLLVDQYVLNFSSTESTVDTFYLNGDRIKRVKFVRRK